MSLKMTVALGRRPGKLIVRVAVSPVLRPDTDPFNIRGDALPGNVAVSSKVPAILLPLSEIFRLLTL
jgi:hypothetical protein